MSNLLNAKLTADAIALFAIIKTIGLSKSNSEEALSWGQIYGRLVYVNHVGVYRDDDFEKLLVTALTPKYTHILSESTGETRELHIISRPLSTGGHTRLMEKIINYENSSDILITRPVRSVKNTLSVKDTTKIHYSQIPYNLSNLISIILRYEVIFLHIDPDDLLAAVAVGVVKKLTNIRVIFVNHADHAFSFGFFSADVVAEVSSYGFHLSEAKRNVSSSFLGIPLAENTWKEIKPVRSKGVETDLNIFSGGSKWKFKPVGELSFPKLAELILNQIPNAKLVIVGPAIVGDWWWWRAKLRHPKRLTILSSMPYNQYTKILSQSDIYLDSFPITGGTALPEVRSKGIPTSGVLSGSFGYTPFDLTKFPDCGSLVRAIKDYAYLNSGEILTRNNDPATLERAGWVHGPNAIKFRLNEMANGTILFRPHDNQANFDINFYTRRWLNEGLVKPDLQFAKFLLSKFSSGGARVLLEFIRITTAKQWFVMLKILFAYFFIRKI